MQRWPDPENGLTENGKKQATIGGTRLRHLIHTADLIVTSPNTRARETAEIIAQRMGYPLAQIITDNRLQEERFGEMENKPFPDFIASLKGVSRFIGGAPGGETGLEVRDRISKLLRLLQNS